MCYQIDNIFACGHRGFAKYDYCVNFGKSCFGAGGNHLENPVPEVCRDCKMRKLDPNPGARLNDPYLAAASRRKASNGGGGNGGSANGSANGGSANGSPG